MRDLLSAADGFVTMTAGSSIHEAHACGAPTVCYGFAVGHVRDNVKALAEHGLARAAASPAELTRALGDALRDRRPPIPDYGRLPTAAELTAKLARDRAEIGA